MLEDQFVRSHHHFLQSRELTYKAKILFVYLSSYSPNFISIRRMSNELGMKRNTLEKVLTELEDLGFIKKYKRVGKTSTYQTLTYDQYRKGYRLKTPVSQKGVHLPQKGYDHLPQKGYCNKNYLNKNKVISEIEILKEGEIQKTLVNEKKFLKEFDSLVKGSKI